MFSDFKKLSVYPALLLLGIGIFSVTGTASAQSVIFRQTKCSFHWKLAVCQPASFRSTGKTYAEMEAERRAAFAAAEAKRRANAWPTAFVKISDDMKHPNRIKIPFAQAPPISAKTRQVDGRRVCEHKNDKGNKSKQDGKDVHIDRECCLDPDEIPNPRCYYPKLGADNAPERITTASGKKIIK